MIQDDIVTLPIHEAHQSSDGAVRIAFIIYKPNNFVSEGLKAVEMATVTFFGSNGSKALSENNPMYLTSPVTLAFKAISDPGFMNRAICGHYDLRRKIWSTDGCYLDAKLRG